MWKFLNRAAGGGSPLIKTLPGADNGVSIAGPEHRWSSASLVLGTAGTGRGFQMSERGRSLLLGTEVTGGKDSWWQGWPMVQHGEPEMKLRCLHQGHQLSGVRMSGLNTAKRSVSSIPGEMGSVSKGPLLWDESGLSPAGMTCKVDLNNLLLHVPC